ncbi:hypothetical protein [Mycolicibacterium sp. XJ870]
MNVSVRSYLMAGAAAATATTLSLTAVQVTPEDIAVPAQSVSVEPQLSQAMVDLLAAASRMTAAVPVNSSGGTPTGEVAPAAAVTAAPGDVSVQNAASDWLTWGYQGIQEWVDWGVNYAADLAFWAAGWGVPFAGLIGNQIDLFYYELIRPIADNIFYQLVVPVVNQPLNIFAWTNGIANAIGYSVNDVIDFGYREFDYFFGWILPPLPPLPPIWPFNTLATTTTLAAASSLASPLADVRDFIGDIVLPPVDFVTDSLTGATTLVLNTSQNLAEGAIDAIEPVFDRLGLDFVNRQIAINYALVEALSNEGVGFVNDLIEVPDNYLNDVLRGREGPIRALGTQVQDVVNSAVDHGSRSVDALGNYIEDQVDFFTPGRLATEAGVANVPTSVRASLKPETAADVPDSTDTTGTRPAQSLAKNIQENVDKTVDGFKQAREDARQARKDARDEARAARAEKAAEKAADKANEKQDEKGSDKSKTTKPAKKQKEKSENSDK